MMKLIVFATLFASFLALTTASVESDEYFFDESPDTATRDYFVERDTNTSGIAIPVSNGTLNYNVSSSNGGENDLKIKFPFSIPGAVATLAEATSDSPNFEDPTVGTVPGSFIGVTFFLTMYDSAGNEIHDMFPKPIEISIFNSEFDANSDLFLFNTTNSKWVSASSTCPNDLQKRTFSEGTLTVSVCHLTQFATFSVAPSPSVTTGSEVVAPSKSKNNTTLIIAIVVPVGAVIIIAAIIIFVVLLRRKRNSGLYDVEMAHHKTKSAIVSAPRTPETRVADFTRGSLKQAESSSDEDSEDSESEIVNKERGEESEETTSSSYEDTEEEESEEDSEDTSTTQETNSSEE